jgi:hypothetical protein
MRGPKRARLYGRVRYMAALLMILGYACGGAMLLYLLVGLVLWIPEFVGGLVYAAIDLWEGRSWRPASTSDVSSPSQSATSDRRS